MKAYEATFKDESGETESKLIGANSLWAAARKAEDEADGGGTVVIKLELTDKVIL